MKKKRAYRKPSSKVPVPQNNAVQTYGPGGTRFLLTETVTMSNELQYKYLSTMFTQSEFVLNATLYKYYRIEKIFVSVYPNPLPGATYFILDWEGNTEFDSAQEIIDSDSVKLRLLPSYRVQNITFKPPNTTFMNNGRAYNFREWVTTANKAPLAQLAYVGFNGVSFKLNLLIHFRGAQDLNVATLIKNLVLSEPKVKEELKEVLQEEEEEEEKEVRKKKVPAKKTAF